MTALRAFLAFAMLGLAASLAASDGYPLHPYSYHEGFENAAPQVGLWASNGESTVSFLGPTEEQAFEGKRSLKLDVTLKSGSYHYWGVPVRVPCAGNLKLSAEVLVAEGTTARVGFGTNMVYPPTQHSGCGADATFDKPTKGWQRVEIDLVARGRQGAAEVMGGYTATVTGDDVGAFLDRWSIFVYGEAGQRAVVYLDDVRIEGEAPSEEDYTKDINARWAANQQRLQKRIDGWQTQLAEARQAFTKMPPMPAAYSQDVDSAKASIDRADKLIKAIAKQGYGSRNDIGDIEAALFVAQYAPETLNAIIAGKAAGQPYLVYAPRVITNARLLPLSFPIPARIAREVRCSGCRGECEAASAAVYALDEVKGLRVTAGDLKGPGGAIPASAVDIFAVKCWYQAGGEIWDVTHKALVPELLLKDDGLVRVDLEKQENYLRSTGPDGTETYLLCSGPTSENLRDVRPMDSASLKPVDIPAGSLKQFWLRIHIPDRARTGLYEGKLSFTNATGTRDLPLRVLVHPFDLAPPRLTYSIYYRGVLTPSGVGTIGSEGKSEQQYRAELEDMKAHGVLYPTNYHGWDDNLQRALQIRKEVGLPTDRFYNLGCGVGVVTSPADADRLKADVRKWTETCRRYGYRDVYFYGMDEATGDALKSQRAAWETVQEAGGKTFVACYAGTFEAMGGLLSCAVLAGKPDPSQARKWHSVGSEAFCYAYPQVGNEEPETYRRNFGLVLWKTGFDGAMDYAYQHGFGHIWNDFDDKTYRDHVFAYPTVNGVVDTVEWEGFHEAVEDVRYVTTLEQAIKAAPPGKAGIAKQAREWLDSVDPASADLYGVRERMVEWISKLKA